jgi:lantibiotic modifying enzyme
MGAKLAMAYERSVFNDERGNWPDFRSSSEAKDFMLSWCHGAPGILLSRQVFKQTDQADNKIDDEIRISRSSTLKMILQTANHKTQQPAHLCCGMQGLTSLLRIDAQVSGCTLPTEVIKAEISLILKAKADGRYNFFSIDKGSINLPGFFTGTSGVALALLEAANGQRWIPEILSAGLLTTPRIESK